MDRRRILVFLYFLPALQATIFNLTLGHEPRGLKMGIVNDELNSSQDRVCNYAKNCSYSMLSCRYLTFLKDNIIQVFSYFHFSKFFYQINLSFASCRFRLKLSRKLWKQEKGTMFGV